jgi:AcrR family transcriptional regulator
MSKKTDPRVIRTQRMLRDALIALIIERGFEALTVRDITDHATLNHATFYLHYQNKEDLLKHTMDAMLNDLAAGIPPPSAQTVEAIHIPLHITMRLFRHFATHAAFYRVMLGAKGVASFTARLREMIAAALLARFDELRHTETASVSSEFAAQFLAGAYISVIVWWLETQPALTPEALAEQFIATTAFGVYRVMGLPIPNNDS